jgi:hypothetical protein
MASIPDQMNIRHNTLIIDDKNPFANCKLDRKKYAITLTRLVSNYKEGFVMSLNNAWGSGKTTFVKMWQQELKLDGYTTLYFNAWENDFDNNPLVALLAEMKTLTITNDATFKTVVKKGAVLAKNILPGIIKAIAEKHLDSATLVDIINKTGEAATEILQEEINEYAQKKKGLTDFRASLEKFLHKINKKQGDNIKPLIFIIDELDRCRPDYAVELLEQVKHFFSVKGVVFVLSIDKEQLCHSIKGYYGSSEFNAHEYLLRFVDLEYTLPGPDAKTFSGYLYHYYGFNDFFYAEARKNIHEFKSDAENFLQMTILLFQHGALTLRQQERVLGHARLALTLVPKNQYLVPTLFVFLLYLRFKHHSLYDDMKKGNKHPGRILSDLKQVYPPELSQQSLWAFFYIECHWLALYAYGYTDKHRDFQLIIKTEGGDQPAVKGNFSEFYPPARMVEEIKSAQRTYNYAKLDFIIEKIELTANVGRIQ